MYHGQTPHVALFENLILRRGNFEIRPMRLAHLVNDPIAERIEVKLSLLTCGAATVTVAGADDFEELGVVLVI